MVISDAFHPLAAHPSDGIEAGIDLGLRTGFGDDWLRLGPMKIFTDGSLVGRTAAMSAPYDGRAGQQRLPAGRRRPPHRRRSSPRTGPAGGSPRTRSATARSTSPSTRSTPRRASYPRRDPRHRIEHFAAARPDQVARAAALGVIPVGQGRFATEIGDGMLAAVGPDRHAWLYRQRSVLDAGRGAARQLRPPGRDRRPAARHPRHGQPPHRLRRPVQRRRRRSPPQEALRAYTWGSAYASKAEHVKGSIEAGKLADFTVLSEDPTAVSPDRIAGLEVIATIVDGELRYSALG